MIQYYCAHTNKICKYALLNFRNGTADCVQHAHHPPNGVWSSTRKTFISHAVLCSEGFRLLYLLVSTSTEGNLCGSSSL